MHRDWSAAAQKLRKRRFCVAADALIAACLRPNQQAVEMHRSAAIVRVDDGNKIVAG